MKGPNWFSSKYYGMTPEEIKKLWSDSGTEASTAGTKMHLHIEMYYNDIQLEIPDDSVEFNHFLTYQRKIGSKYIPWRTEWSVFFEDALIAGQIDMIYKNPVTGKFIVGDWKRAKEIKRENRFQNMLAPVDHLPDTNLWHYTLQLSIYRYFLEVKYGMEFEDQFLVVLHPNNPSFVQVKLPYLKDEVKDMLEDRKRKVREGVAQGSRSAQAH